MGLFEKGERKRGELWKKGGKLAKTLSIFGHLGHFYNLGIRRDPTFPTI